MRAWATRSNVGVIGAGVVLAVKDTRIHRALFSERECRWYGVGVYPPRLGCARSRRGFLLLRVGPWLMTVGRVS